MINTTIQLLLFIGLVWFISFNAQIKITRLSFKLQGRFLYLSLASAGVIVHELSHALVAIVFGHRVRKIVFFNPDISSSSLGYVVHSYNPLNIYHRIGCFFIGFAPLYLAPIFIMIASHLLLPSPDYFYDVISHIGTFTIPQALMSIDFFLDFFRKSYDSSPKGTIVWLFLSCSISLSCGPSPADIKNATAGLIPFTAIIIVSTHFLDFDFPSIVIGSAYLLLGFCLLQIIALSTLILVWSITKTLISKLLLRPRKMQE